MQIFPFLEAVQGPLSSPALTPPVRRKNYSGGNILNPCEVTATPASGGQGNQLRKRGAASPCGGHVPCGGCRQDTCPLWAQSPCPPQSASLTIPAPSPGVSLHNIL